MLTVSFEEIVCRDCKKVSRRPAVWCGDEILEMNRACQHCGGDDTERYTYCDRCLRFMPAEEVETNAEGDELCQECYEETYYGNY